jgi:hypothetical protein
LPEGLGIFVRNRTNNRTTSSGSSTSTNYSSASTIFSDRPEHLSEPFLVSWIPHLLLTGIGLIVSFFLGLSMITTLLFISLILTSFCWKNKHTKKEIDNKSIGYFFFDKCLEFFLCFDIVVIFYACLSWVVEGTSDQTTLGWLQSLEGFLLSVNKFVSFLKIKPWYAVLIILGLIIVDLSVSYFFNSRKPAGESETTDAETVSETDEKVSEMPPSNLASRYKTYHTWSKRFYTVTVLLCSFTFFGNTVLGERVAHLRINIDKIRDGYEKLKEETEKLLMASVQQKIYEKVKESLPSDIKNDFDYPKIIVIDLNNVRADYERLKTYGVTNPEAEAAIKNYEAQAKRYTNITNEQTIDDEIKPKNVEVEKPSKPESVEVEKTSKPNPKPETTIKSVEKPLAEIKSKITFRTRAISLLKLDGAKELLVQFPKSLTDVTKNRIFSEIVKTHPILEPVFDIVSGTIDKFVENKVKESAVIAADALIDSPQNAERIINKEATKIADSIEIKKDEATVGKIKGIFIEIKTQLSKIKEVNQKVRLLVEKYKPKPLPPVQPKPIPKNTPESNGCCYCVITENGREVSRRLMGCDKGCIDGTYEEQCEGIKSFWRKRLNKLPDIP